MKKILIGFVFLMLAAAVFAANVDRSVPERVDPSTAFTVTFTINPEGSLTAFDLADFVPSGWILNDWSVSGYSKSDVAYDSQTRDYQGKTRNGLHWSFTKPFGSPITLSYAMNAPALTGTYEFIAVWTYPGGFNSKTGNLVVGTAPTPPPTPSPPPAPTPISQPPSTPQPTPTGSNYNTIAVIVVLLIVVVGGYMYFRKPKGKSLSYDYSKSS